MRKEVTTLKLFTNCLLPLLIYVFFFDSVLFSQNKDTLYWVNPDGLVAEELLSRRIVMLGDVAHHSSDSYYSVTDIFNEWLHIIKKVDKRMPNLVFILENSYEDIRIINEYLKTGSFELLKELTLPYVFIEDYEFLTLLRDFGIEFNNTLSHRTNKITFSVKGFEEIGYKITEENLKKNLRERELWYVKQRDSMVAVQIIKYLKDNPEDNALIFYGDAHLQNGYVHKRTFSLAPEESNGYYLAYYLKNEFGNEQVITISQKFLNPDFFNNTQLEKFRDENLLVKSNIMFEEWNSERYDYWILRHTSNAFFPSHPINYVFSKSLIDKYINLAKWEENYIPYEEAIRLYNADIFHLNFLTCQDFKSVNDVLNWIQENDYNGFEVLDSREFGVKIYRNYFKKGYRFFLNQLGFEKSILDTNFNTDSLDWNLNVWPNALGHIKFFNCVSMLWIGTDDEKINSKNYLIDFSGEHFQEPEKYFQWYRKKYYGYAY